MTNLDNEIQKAKAIPKLFELVKRVVREYLGLEQAGLMVGLSDLGVYQGGFVGAFYSLNSNMIIINKRVLSHVDPKIYNYYLFHIMLHEYIHAVGSYDEDQTRVLVKEICEHHFGQSHITTQLALDIGKFVKGVIPHEPVDISIDFVENLDRKNMNYIG